MKMILSSKVFSDLEATNKIREFVGKSFEELKVLLVQHRVCLMGQKNIIIS